MGVQTPLSQVSGPQPLFVPGPSSPRWVRLGLEAPTLRAAPAVVAGTAAPGGAAGTAASPMTAAAVASMAVPRAWAPAAAPAGVVAAQAAGGRGGAGPVVGDGTLSGTGDASRLHETGRVPTPLSDRRVAAGATPGAGGLSLGMPGTAFAVFVPAKRFLGRR